MHINRCAAVAVQGRLRTLPCDRIFATMFLRLNRRLLKKVSSSDECYEYILRLVQWKTSTACLFCRTVTGSSLSVEMSRLTRDGTAEPVSRDQILRYARGQGDILFHCSADHKQNWQPYPVDPYSAIYDDHTYCSVHTNVSGLQLVCTTVLRCTYGRFWFTLRKVSLKLRLRNCLYSTYPLYK